MLRLAFLIVAMTAALGACTASRDFQGYIADEAKPADIQPDKDTRSTVLAQLGSPSTSSLFDENTWFYMSTTRERFAFYRPKVVTRQTVAIRFDESDTVAEVLEYDAKDGRVIRYASRETPTRGRQLGLLEQIFGNVGAVRLPNSEERTPGDIGRR